MKNVLLGISVNFDQFELKNLILSFREFNKEDDMILFVDPKQLETLSEAFKNYDVMFKPLCFHDMCDTPIHNTRYVKCYEFLLEHNEYKNVFLCDTKDVVFQGNPFKDLADDFLYTFQEDSGLRIFDDPTYNGPWIHYAFGPEVLEKIGHNIIICSGTILGSRNRILQLLESVKREMMRIKIENPHAFSNMIMDQGIVNYFARTDEKETYNITVKENGDIVATVGVTLSDSPLKKDTVLMKDTHILVNGREPSVIHQYDRIQYLKVLFDIKYQL